MKHAFSPFLVLLFVSCTCSHAQETPYQGEKKFNAQQLQNDFDILVSTIQTHHPSPYRYITTDSLDRFATFIKNKIKDGMTDNDFQLLAREFLAQVKCGHTVARPSNEWYAWISVNSKFFPFEIVIFDNRIFVKTIYAKETGLTRGTQILAIDGTPAGKILQQMQTIQPRDGFGQSFVHHSIQDVFSTYYLFLYGAKQTYDITWKSQAGESVTSKIPGIGKGVIKEKIHRPDSSIFSKHLSCQWSTLYLHAGKKTALLDINAFGGKKRKKYYKKVFAELKKNNTKHLIIDLRNNGGGYFPNGTRLCRYLSPEPFTFDFNRSDRKLRKQKYARMGLFSKATKGLFRLLPDPVKKNGIREYQIHYKPFKKNHYNGSLYVFTNGGSFSMSGYTATFLKYRLKAVTIGEETGGTEEGSRGILGYTLTLPATQIVVNVPYFNLDHKIPEANHGRGVMADQEIKYNLEQLLQEKDLELEKALDIIGG